MTAERVERLRTAAPASTQTASYLLVVGAFAVAAVVLVPPTLLVSVGVALALPILLALLLHPSRAAAGIGMVVSVTTMLALRDFSNQTTAGELWGAACLVVLSSPFFLRPLRRLSGFSFLHLWCMVEGIYVYVSLLLSRPTIYYVATFPPEIREQGYRILTLFTIVLVGTALVVERVLSRNGAVNVERYVPGRDAAVRAYVLIAVSGLLTLATTVTKVDKAIGTLALAITLIGFGGWLILVMLWMEGRCRVRDKLVAVIYPLAWVGLILGEGALYQTAYPGFLLLGLFMFWRKTIPWGAMLIALAALLAINSVKGDFRHDVSEGRVEGSTVELGASWLEKTRDSFADEDNTEQITASAWRFANSDILGYLAEWVPDRYPYFGHQMYVTLPEVLIPRVLLPDKPSYNFENEFGRDYELIARSDYETTVNTPLHVEAYVAGGPITLVAVGMLVGAYFAVLNLAFRANRPATVITGCLLGLQVVLSCESGILAILLIVPFALLLLPLMRWGTNPVPAPTIGGERVADPLGPPRRRSAGR